MLSLRSAQQVLSLDDIINTSHLRRWHMVAVSREQTLAEHQYLVAMMATKVLLECAHHAHPNLAAIQRQVLEEALLHDVHEISSGDQPANPIALERQSAMLQGLDLPHMIQKDYWVQKFERRELPPPGWTPAAVVRFVKVADSFEALTYYALHGDPRTYPERGIAHGCVNRVLKAALALTDEDQKVLCLNHGEILKWTYRSLVEWSDRFSPHIGAEFPEWVREEAFNRLPDWAHAE